MVKKPRVEKIKPTQKKSKRAKKPSFLIVVPLITISIFVLIATIYGIIDFVTSHQNNNFPKLEISLKDASIEQIDLDGKDIKYPGNTVTFILNNKSAVYENVELKGRGNTTWMQPKKPYQIKLNEKNSFFSYGESKKWVLLANYLDPTHLRTAIAYRLESILKTKKPLSGHHIELYIDGFYRGLYFLSEKVEIDKSRIDLKDSNGIIMELENLHNTPEGCFYSNNSDCFIVQDLVNSDQETTAINDFIDTINKLESAISSKDYKSIDSLIDTDSFAIYYLLNEFLVNPDAYSSSFFLYKDGLDNKIFAGPGWDFDLSISNSNWYVDEKEYDTFHSPFTDTVLKDRAIASKSSDPNSYSASTLLYDLLDIPEFKARVIEIYQDTLSGHGGELLDYIKTQANYIRDAAYRDQARWKLKTNFDEEVNYLLDWISKRYDHFEETYGKNTDTSNPALTPESPQPSEE